MSPSAASPAPPECRTDWSSEPLRKNWLNATPSRGRVTRDLLDLAAVVETLDDPALATTLDGTIRGWNAGAERLFGYCAAEIVGKKIDTLVPPERVDEIEELLERLRRGGTITQYETVRAFA